jgi:hypothetical protein
MNRTALSLLALTLILPATGAARTVREPGMSGFCATRASTPAISFARHQFNLRRQASARSDRLAVGQPGIQSAVRVTKRRHIAVIEDDGTIFPPANLFDLAPQGEAPMGVQFRRSGRSTRAQAYLGGVSSTRGERIEIGDDASRAIDLPFPFRFYGIVYTRVFLNSDGNLTFTRAESASTARSLNRFIEGPPRIAVDFLDLDPTAATGSGGVYLLEEPGRVRITWLEVPEFGIANSNTFQVTLFPNGRITMAYEDVDALTGIVGVSPGGPGPVNLVDLSSELPLTGKRDAIAEQFSEEPQIDDQAAARAVLSVVRDKYDVIVLFADFRIDLDGDALAYNSAIKNDIRGIGDDVGYDFSASYGSDGRLEAFVQMGSLANYPVAPNNLIRFSEAPGIGILAHEVGHRWLAFVRFINGQGQRSTDLLGRQLGHWSFLMDTDGSVMEGNDIRDNGDGTFTTVATWAGFSRLDQYLMGFRRASEVPPFFYVSGSQLDPEGTPSTGVKITGQRRDVTIDQIIAAEGPRVPDFAGAQKTINVAFALLGKKGQPPSTASIKRVGRYRNRLASYFREQTGGEARIKTSLRLKPQ